MAKEQDLLINHDYDGIRELDNDLPPWWVHLFNVTILFSLVYLLYYHVFDMGLDSAAEYEQELASAAGSVQDEAAAGSGTSLEYNSPLAAFPEKLVPRIREQFKYYIGEEVTFERLIAEARSKATEEQLNLLDGGGLTESLAAAQAAESVSAAEISSSPAAGDFVDGKTVFMQNCAVCHGQRGEGLIGPNMTDKYWVHGGTKDEINKIINVGVPIKGMVPWKGIITNQQIDSVVDYILSLQGTNPPNQKAPEGELVK